MGLVPVPVVLPVKLLYVTLLYVTTCVALALLYVTMYVATMYVATMYVALVMFVGRGTMEEARQGLEVRGIRGKREGAGKEVTGLSPVGGKEEQGKGQKGARRLRVQRVILRLVYMLQEARVVYMVQEAATPLARGVLL